MHRYPDLRFHVGYVIAGELVQVYVTWLVEISCRPKHLVESFKILTGWVPVYPWLSGRSSLQMPERAGNHGVQAFEASEELRVIWNIVVMEFNGRPVVYVFDFNDLRAW